MKGMKKKLTSAKTANDPNSKLIKHFVLGIASLIICSIAMADIGKTKEFMKNIKEVLAEYPEDSVQRKIPIYFIATVAAAETGNFNFKDAPTAKSANNQFFRGQVGSKRST